MLIFNQSDRKTKDNQEQVRVRFPAHGTGCMILFRAVIGLLLQFMSLARVTVINTPSSKEDFH